VTVMVIEDGHVIAEPAARAPAPPPERLRARHLCRALRPRLRGERPEAIYLRGLRLPPTRLRGVRHLFNLVLNELCLRLQRAPRQPAPV
jgi:hypothetical protein